MAFYEFNPIELSYELNQHELSYVDFLHAYQQSEHFTLPHHRCQAAKTDQYTSYAPAVLLTTLLALSCFLFPH
jgi:hypothetical protein